MKNLIDKLAVSQKTFTTLVFIFLIIQPIIELDYLMNDFLKQYGLIVPSTFIRYLGLPLLAVIGFISLDHKKKRTFMTTFIIGVISVVYVVFHFVITKNLNLKFPIWYRYSNSIELKYILTLALPFVLMYVIYLARFTKTQFKNMILCVSGFVSILIVASNVLGYSFGSYGGMTQANFISWFTGGYDLYNAKELTSVGFYRGANEMGALLFVLLPVMYYALFTATKKWPALLLIMTQSLAMFMIGTRVSTYGLIAVNVVTLVAYLILILLKKEKFKKVEGVFLGVMTVVVFAILPNAPAMLTQSSDSLNIANLKENEDLSQLTEDVEGIDMENEEEYNYALLFILENNVHYFTFPSEYYYGYYPLEFDPAFWYDVLQQPFEARSNGRALQKLFADYKWDMLTPTQKLVGMGYSKISDGGMIIEQDFYRQYYTLGVLGLILFVMPLPIILALSAFNLLRKFNKLVNFENCMLGLSACAGLGAAYYSGHVLDLFITNFFIATVLITLYLNSLKDKVDV